MNIWKSKQLIFTLLVILCSGNSYATISVFACEPEWAALVRALAGDKARVFSATTAQQDPHHIQARPSLIAKARRADLLVCTGAGLETGWLPLLLRKSGNGRIQAGQAGHFMATEHVLLLEQPASLDRSQGDIHAAGNPHIHLDPRRMTTIASQLAKTLMAIDVQNQDHYRQNWATFNDQWLKAIADWEQQAQVIRGKKIVVNHNSWVYLENWLQLQRLATLEPKPGIAPSSSHLAKVLAGLETNPADMILYASYQDDKAVQWLARKTGIPIVALPFSVAQEQTLFQWFEQLLSQLLAVQS